MSHVFLIRGSCSISLGSADLYWRNYLLDCFKLYASSTALTSTFNMLLFGQKRLQSLFVKMGYSMGVSVLGIAQGCFVRLNFLRL